MWNVYEFTSKVIKFFFISCKVFIKFYKEADSVRIPCIKDLGIILKSLKKNIFHCIVATFIEIEPFVHWINSDMVVIILNLLKQPFNYSSDISQRVHGSDSIPCNIGPSFDFKLKIKVKLNVF